LEYTVFIRKLLGFRIGAFTVSVILGDDAASTSDWYTTIRDGVVVSAPNTSGTETSVFSPPTALSNSDNRACWLRGTKFDFKFHSEKKARPWSALTVTSLLS